MSFDRFIHRAQNLARAHFGAGYLEIVKREWMWATNPDIAVVHIHFRDRKNLGQYTHFRRTRVSSDVNPLVRPK